MIRVAYDISVLAGAHFLPNRRTGIHRVVHELAIRLAKRPDCELTLVAQQSVDDALALHAVSAELGSRPLLLANHQRGFAQALAPLNRRLRNQSHERTHPVRIAKRLLQRAEAAWGTRWAQGMDALSELDVYHSPVLALPRHTRSIARLQRFVTCYDLVPVLFPKLSNRYDERWIRKLVASLTPRDWVICISEATKRDFCEYSKHPADRVFVTHLAADDAIFYPMRDTGRLEAVGAKYGIPPDPYFLAVSTQDPKKNLDRLVRCFVELLEQERLAGLNLVLVGGRHATSAVIDRYLAAKPALRDRVIRTGRVDDGDLAPLYSHALAFIYPSLYEGFGLPVLEAMSCGTAVVASSASSIPEVTGDAAILVDPTDDAELSSAMLEVYAHSERRARLAAMALQRAALFSWEKTAEETLAAYRTATAK